MSAVDLKQLLDYMITKSQLLCHFSWGGISVGKLGQLHQNYPPLSATQLLLLLVCPAASDGIPFRPSVSPALKLFSALHHDAP